MRILIVGAGALGGYFGGRLLAAGKDVTFLVRPRRAKQLAATGGLIIKSPKGNLALPNPPLITADKLKHPYDLIILACKAGALQGCISDFAPAVGKDTTIIPVLNGMRHIDMLADRFDRARVLGCRAFIFATLDADGRVLHQGDTHTLDIGELSGKLSPRVEAIAAAIGDAGFLVRPRDGIVLDMWEKWVTIATVAGATGMMRAAIGDIVRAGGLDFILALMRETAEIAHLNGHQPGEKHMETLEKTVSDPSSVQMASLAKDIDKGYPTETEHIFGDLLARVHDAGKNAFPFLTIVYTTLKAYEERRKRENDNA